MEVYFKNLTGDEVSVEKLVEDLLVLADDMEHLVRATGASLTDGSKEELMSALQRFKGRCVAVRTHAIAGAKATDKAIRTHPYVSLGIALGTGFLLAWLIKPRD
jgi:ElaB/YqjD/DUF883 family membrane-anchored ribosome-binding protein